MNRPPDGHVRRFVVKNINPSGRVCPAVSGSFVERWRRRFFSFFFIFFVSPFSPSFSSPVALGSRVWYHILQSFCVIRFRAKALPQGPDPSPSRTIPCSRPGNSISFWSMGSEATSEFMLDQGMYYPPAAADYYGYYCTGNETSGEWDDHRFFGLDGRDIHYSGLQAESSPYVYYMPSYEYTQSSYNPYNPYIPGAVEFDGTLAGAQPYFNPSFQQVTSSPAYHPFIVHSTSEIGPLPYGPPDPSHFSTISSVPGNHDGAVATFAPSLASSIRVPTTRKVSSGNVSLEPPKSLSYQIKDTLNKGEQHKDNGLPKKQSTLNGVVLPGMLSPSTQVKNSIDPVQPVAHLTNENFRSFENPSKTNFATKTGLANFERNLPSSVNVDKLDTRFQTQSNRTTEDGGRLSNLYTWQTRGPRTTRARSQKNFVGIPQDNNILVYVNHYNRDDLLIDYPDAKFFVIKSYSEDDVHKSIKYNVWSSTINGNKKLNIAFEDAQRISAGNQGKCPIFLFFSVNGSGHFCGVAEMVGPVDFQKDMDFWQQNKWTGSFPVKWHIIKDIANTNLRHILLENNENRPVTHSRDTQELLYVPGMNMLEVFKDSPLEESILDDFLYYDEKEKLLHQERARTLKKNHGSPLYVPIFVPSSASNSTINEAVPLDQQSNLVPQPLETNELRPMTTMVLSNDQKEEHDNLSQTMAGHVNEEKCSTIHHPQVECHTKSDENQIPSSPCHVSTSDNIVGDGSSDADRTQLQEATKKATNADHGELNTEASHSQKKTGGNASTSSLARDSGCANTLRCDAKPGQLTINDIVTVGSVQIKLLNAQENPGILTESKVPMNFRGVNSKMSLKKF